MKDLLFTDAFFGVIIFVLMVAVIALLLLEKANRDTIEHIKRDRDTYKAINKESRVRELKLQETVVKLQNRLDGESTNIINSVTTPLPAKEDVQYYTDGEVEMRTKLHEPSGVTVTTISGPQGSGKTNLALQMSPKRSMYLEGEECIKGKQWELDMKGEGIKNLIVDCVTDLESAQIALLGKRKCVFSELILIAQNRSHETH